ncbi:uncharacterized protein LOC114308433 [Camellia sinensis]|uniref:uncharacterized protein LOC114308433 n=1 Tax=Camellia sinensis TaxID=4442 RepID=UPI001035DA29|nr:uncharacterized protein LOC114308433 [Camellia sinensis]XP_028109821.1 uncharacterized protein LOC114308433 [Camellia sinensis]
MSSLICRTLHHVRSSVRACSSTYNNLYFIQIHTFSSSSLETTPNQHSFAVNYFINSCGFPLEKALSASNYVKFETPNKPDSVLAFFENHGFTKTQISNLVRRYPPVILCDPEKTLLPKFQFFKSKGVSSTDVAKILSSAPAVLKRSMENQIIPSFNFFKSFIQSEEETISAIKRNAGLLLVDLQNCALPNVEILREANVPDAKILFMLKFMPRAFILTSDRLRKIVNEVKKMGFNPSKSNFVLAVHALKSMSKSTWGKKVEVYKKWGLSEDDILVAFGKYPWCMMASEHKIVRVMDFFVNKMGWRSFLVARRPWFISMSFEKRIVPRCAVYQVLLSKGLIQNNDITLATMLKYTEKVFLTEVVNCHQEEAPELLKLYKEKLAVTK